MTLPRAAIVLAILFFSSAAAWGAPRTDVVTLVNGDRITGEIRGLNRGQLEFKTDHAGTLAIDWDEISNIESTRRFEVETSDGRRSLGSLERTDDRSVLIRGSDSAVSWPMQEVTRITPIGRSFWAKLEGSFDGGFTYTRSSGVSQTTLNSVTEYRRPAFEVQLAASATLTTQPDETKHNNQGSVELGYVRFRGRRWFVGGSGRLETNESLGLVLRSQAGGLFGQRLVNTNRAQLQIGEGLVVNNEQGVDTGATQNVEGVLTLKSSYFKYAHPKTNFDTTITYYPSLSSWGRQRLQVNSAVNRELWRDFYVGLTAFDTFDSAPPQPDAAHNDVGVVVSIGWSYGR